MIKGGLDTNYRLTQFNKKKYSSPLYDSFSSVKYGHILSQLDQRIQNVEPLLNYTAKVHRILHCIVGHLRL